MSSYLYEVITHEPEIPFKCFSYQYSNFIVDPHWHNSIEIIRVEQGRMYVTIGEKKWTLENNQFIIINSREIHSTISSPDTLVEVLQIPYPFLKKYMPGMEQFQFKTGITLNVSDQTVPSKCSELIHKIINQSEEKRACYLIDLHSFLFQLLHYLYTDYLVPADVKAISQGDVNRQRLTKVMDYVNTHYKEHISLEETAQLISLNKEYFCRFFKRYMGMSFLNYVNEVRFRHVCEELLSKDMNIMVLLEEHGFSNYKLFMKMFRERYHCTPSERRKQV